MNRTTTHLGTVVVGGGPAGLALSHGLTGAGVDHVVIERGRLAERWRSERWDSLRLLTPNWMTRLPGRTYEGPDPHGYMTAAEVVEFMVTYAASFGAPVLQGVSVERVATEGPRFSVRTDSGDFVADSVVVATGAAGTPSVPRMADCIDDSIAQLHARDYRSPEALRAGGVLVVGASASGAQIADELARAGRGVTLAVGEHTRLPRTYRNIDIHWWLDAMGVLDRRTHTMADLEAARREPSLQLVGRPDRRQLDLNTLRETGVTLTGRLEGIAGTSVRFGDDLAALAAGADARQDRVLDRIDRLAGDCDLLGNEPPVARPAATEVGAPPTRADLETEGISTVLWATGYRRTYPWLDVPVLDGRGEILHDGGVTPVAGMYAVGLPWLRRRKSTFIDGIGSDAAEVTDHLLGHLGHNPTGTLRPLAVAA